MVRHRNLAYGSMRLFALILRRLALCCFTVCLGGLGPAVLAALPGTLTMGAEEETRCAVAHVVGSCPSAKCRSVGGPGVARRSEAPRLRDVRTSRCVSLSRKAFVSLCDMNVRIQV